MAIPMADTSKPENDQWEVEYCSTEEDPEGVAWLSEAMNRLIACVSTLDGDELKAALGQYADVDRIIDYLVFITVLRAEDNRPGCWKSLVNIWFVIFLVYTMAEIWLTIMPMGITDL